MTRKKKGVAAKKADTKSFTIEGKEGGELKGYHQTGRVLTTGEDLVFLDMNEVAGPADAKKASKMPEVYNDLGEVWGYTDDGQLMTVREDRGLLGRPRRSRGTKRSSKDRSRARGGARKASARRPAAGKTGRASKR